MSVKLNELAKMVNTEDVGKESLTKEIETEKAQNK